MGDLKCRNKNYNNGHDEDGGMNDEDDDDNDNINNSTRYGKKLNNRADVKVYRKPQPDNGHEVLRRKIKL